MKRPLIITILLLILPAALAQHLVKDDFWTLEQIGEGYYDVEISMIYADNFGITGRNEVKGSIISTIWFRDAGLTPPDEVSGLQVSFFQQTDFGYYAVFDDPDFNITDPRTVLVLYNHEKVPTRQFLLSDVFANGRVVDFRYADGRFYLALGNETLHTEFGYFSYQLYCFDIQADRIIWRTNYEVSKGQFDVLDKYVISGFGGSGIEDFVYLIDRRTGVALDYVPTQSMPQYIEATRTQDTVYVVDYNNIIYRYLIVDRCVHVTGRGVRLRRGPSTDHAIFSDAQGRPIYPLAGDNLAYLGQSGDFYKVRFKQQELYISKRYTELRNPKLEKEKLLTRFQEALYSRGEYVAAPVSILFVDVDDDGIDERICKDLNDQLAVFTARNQQHELLFIDNLDNTHIYPSSGAFRTYMSLSNGYESEAIYLVKNSRLQATYLRENDTYSKILAPASSSQSAPSASSKSAAPTKIKAKEYEAQRARLTAAPELTLDSCFDL